jgi:hypothetical protein
MSPWEGLFITLDHMEVWKSPDKVFQSNIGKDVSITGARIFRFAPNFVPTFQTTIDEVHRVKIDSKELKAT